MGSDSEPASSTLHTYPTLTKDQRRVSKKLANLLSSNIGETLPRYGGDIVADLIPELQSLRGSIVAGRDDSLDSSMRQALVENLSGEASYDLSKEAIQGRFRDTVVNPLMRTFEDQIKPQISEAFSSQGAIFSSRRGDATRRALEGLQTQMTGELSNMMYQSEALRAQLEDSAAARQLQAMGPAEGFAQRNMNEIGQQMALLNPFQQYDQSKATADYQEFLRTRPENSPYNSLALGFTGQKHQDAYMTVEEPESQFDWGGMLGGLGAVGGTLAGFGLTGGFSALGSGASLGTSHLIGGLLGGSLGKTFGGSLGYGLGGY